MISALKLLENIPIISYTLVVGPPWRADKANRYILGVGEGGSILKRRTDLISSRFQFSMIWGRHHVQVRQLVLECVGKSSFKQLIINCLKYELERKGNTTCWVAGGAIPNISTLLKCTYLRRHSLSWRWTKTWCRSTRIHSVPWVRFPSLKFAPRYSFRDPTFTIPAQGHRISYLSCFLRSTYNGEWTSFTLSYTYSWLHLLSAALTLSYTFSSLHLLFNYTSATLTLRYTYYHRLILQRYFCYTDS